MKKKTAIHAPRKISLPTALKLTVDTINPSLLLVLTINEAGTGGSFTFSALTAMEQVKEWLLSTEGIWSKNMANGSSQNLMLIIKKSRQ